MGNQDVTSIRDQWSFILNAERGSEEIVNDFHANEIIYRTC